jgi:hypothetical protein
MSASRIAVVLTEDGYLALSRFLGSYLRESSTIGRYIYATKAEESGSFVNVTFDPADCNNKISSRMRISIPTCYVLFMAEGAVDKTMGF